LAPKAGLAGAAQPPDFSKTGSARMVERERRRALPGECAETPSSIVVENRDAHRH
jgi:hypothetical protein